MGHRQPLWKTCGAAVGSQRFANHSAFPGLAGGGCAWQRLACGAVLECLVHAHVCACFFHCAEILHPACMCALRQYSLKCHCKVVSALLSSMHFESFLSFRSIPDWRRPCYRRRSSVPLFSFRPFLALRARWACVSSLFEAGVHWQSRSQSVASFC